MKNKKREYHLLMTKIRNAKVGSVVKIGKKKIKVTRKLKDEAHLYFLLDVSRDNYKNHHKK